MKWWRDLFIFVVVFLLVVGSVWLVIGTYARPQVSQPSRPVAVWKGLALPLEIESAAQRAQERAQDWQSDVVLVRVDASWRPGPERLHLEIPPVAWSFYYYSPTAGTVASVVVDAAYTFWVPPVPVTSPLVVLDPFPPLHGSRTAWLTFRAAGGEEFIRAHPDAAVTLVLREEERPVWTVLAAFEGHHLEVRVDADTGLAVP